VIKDAKTSSSPAGVARRWLPAAIVPAAVIAAVVTVPAVADSTPNLPEKSAAQVLALVASSVDATYSGTVEQSADFGLPELPAMGPGSSSHSAAGPALELLSGSHTARVYVGSDETARLQVMDTLAQRDVVINGSDVWLYSSSANEAIHLLLPDAPTGTPDPATLPSGIPTTPAELAEQLIAAVDPSTEIVVGDTARVADRSVYTLTLSPDATDTLVHSVTLSVDADTGLPLAATARAADQTEPAFSIEFSDITFEAPDDELFTFTPPEGAAVTEEDLTDDAARFAAEYAANGALPESMVPDPTVPDGTHPVIVGEGWSSIAVIPAEAIGSAPQDPEAQQLLAQLTTAVPEGRLFESALVSALLTTDGRLLIGAVSGAQLQAAATAP
jgi:outer membrane lipoprotein-sorting protein